MNPALPKALIMVAICLIGGACARTDYVRLDQERPSVPGIPLRSVGVQIDQAYFNDYPNCTIVMPTQVSAGLEKFKGSVEAALGRHLTAKISRVIGQAERDFRSRQAGVDLTDLGDRVELSKLLGCDTILNSVIIGPGYTYLVVWSQVQIGLEVVMVRVRDGRVLWRARHIADRSDGGLPLSPIGLAVDGYASAQFAADSEIADSVVDDAVRRLVRSLPDARVYR